MCVQIFLHVSRVEFFKFTLDFASPWTPQQVRGDTYREKEDDLFEPKLFE